MVSPAKIAKNKRFFSKTPLKLFAGFDERGYYPTLEFKFVRDETGHLVGALQLFRKQEDENVAEWRECPMMDLPAVNKNSTPES